MWLFTLMSLVMMVVVLARVAAAEARLYNTESRGIFAKALLWGLNAFTQEGESRQEDT